SRRARTNRARAAYSSSERLQLPAVTAARPTASGRRGILFGVWPIISSVPRIRGRRSPAGQDTPPQRALEDKATGTAKILGSRYGPGHHDAGGPASRFPAARRASGGPAGRGAGAPTAAPDRTPPAGEGSGRRGSGRPGGGGCEPHPGGAAASRGSGRGRGEGARGVRAGCGRERLCRPPAARAAELVPAQAARALPAGRKGGRRSLRALACARPFTLGLARRLFPLARPLVPSPRPLPRGVAAPRRLSPP